MNVTHLLLAHYLLPQWGPPCCAGSHLFVDKASFTVEVASFPSLMTSNVADHRRCKAECGGALCDPRGVALLGISLNCLSTIRTVGCLGRSK